MKTYLYINRVIKYIHRTWMKILNMYIEDGSIGFSALYLINIIYLIVTFK